MSYKGKTLVMIFKLFQHLLKIGSTNDVFSFLQTYFNTLLYKATLDILIILIKSFFLS